MENKSVLHLYLGFPWRDFPETSRLSYRAYPRNGASFDAINPFTWITKYFPSIHLHLTGTTHLACPIKNVRLVVSGSIMKAPFLEEQSTFSSVTRPSFEEFSCKTVHLTRRIRYKRCKFGCVRPHLGLHATDINP